MSHKYIHEDLHRLVEKYFDIDNGEINPSETENYMMCELINNIIDDYGNQYYNDELINNLCERESFNILNKIINNTYDPDGYFEDSLANDIFENACCDNNFNIAKFILKEHSYKVDIVDNLIHALRTYNINIAKLIIEEICLDWVVVKDRYEYIICHYDFLYGYNISWFLNLMIKKNYKKNSTIIKYIDRFFPQIEKNENIKT